MGSIFGIILGLLGFAILAAIFVGFGYLIYYLVKKLAFGNNTNHENSKDNNMHNNPVQFIKNTLLGRAILVFCLILISLVPLAFVSDLATERSHLYNSVSNRMTNEWSGTQRIAGPILTIPYTYTSIVMDKIKDWDTNEIRYVEKRVLNRHNLHILPENLDIQTSLKTQELKRGIYSVPIYESTHSIKGQFKWLDTSILTNKPEKILWDKAFVSFLISNPKGIQSGTKLVWNNQQIDLSSGVGLSSSNNNGIHARTTLSNDFYNQPINFDMTLNLRGSQSIDYAPTGRHSDIIVDANWPDPSFVGELLPVKRDITNSSFHAEWKIPHLSRSYGQLSATPENKSGALFKSINQFAMGVNLFETVNLYTLLNRTIKYGIMFISLTFISICVVEFASAKQLHWVQHLIIGAALSLFYLCVLALSEHIAFGYAYAIGMALIAMLLGVYSSIAIGQWKYGFSIAGVIIALYTVLYSILQMEDYALLIGTGLLVIFLVIGMVTTRKLNQ